MWNGCPLYEQFGLDLSLWRYLPWYKFEDLLKTSSLFFTRADHLTKEFDDAEGAMTASEKELVDITLEGMHNYLSGQNTAVLRVSGLPFHGVRSLDVAAYRDNVAKVYAYYMNNMYVNCWHHNSTEDASMWKEYVPDGNGVAIHTTSRALVNSLKSTAEEVIGSMVEYVDHAKEPITDALRRGGGLYLVLLQMLIRKRLRFSAERELRLLTCPLSARELYGPLLRNDLPFDKENAEIGRRLTVNLAELKLEVTLHPNASSGLRERVAELLKHAAPNHETSVSNSSIRKGTL